MAPKKDAKGGGAKDKGGKNAKGSGDASEKGKKKIFCLTPCTKIVCLLDAFIFFYLKQPLERRKREEIQSKFDTFYVKNKVKF